MATTTPESWAAWLNAYGAENFYNAFLLNCQGARSTCRYCGLTIELDIEEGGGVPDWGAISKHGLDYGCTDSPDTDEEGCGSHLPPGALGWKGVARRKAGLK